MRTTPNPVALPKYADLEIVPLGEGMAEIRLSVDGRPCRHHVRWDRFCQTVLLCDYEMRNGTAALQSLLSRCNEPEDGK
jgi:hypothetical protein